MELMHTETTAVGSVTVLCVAGAVDLSTATRLTTELVELIETVPLLVVDLDQLTFLDSTGLSALVNAANTAAERGVGLRLARPTRNVGDLLAVTALDQLIPTFDTLDEAVRAQPTG